jgi:hypothetical protein
MAKSKNGNKRYSKLCVGKLHQILINCGRNSYMTLSKIHFDTRQCNGRLILCKYT